MCTRRLSPLTSVYFKADSPPHTYLENLTVTFKHQLLIETTISHIGYHLCIVIVVVFYQKARLSSSLYGSQCIIMSSSFFVLPPLSQLFTWSWISTPLPFKLQGLLRNIIVLYIT